tara:strand:- start:1292 stop:1726 length:435 start_codon:yes stop_codon:yes gene_type:complete
MSEDTKMRDTPNKDYHAVIKLLIARMDSHPEEFTGAYKRWHNLIAQYRENFTQDEFHAYSSKLTKLDMEAFHQEVLKRLLTGSDVVTGADVNSKSGLTGSYQMAQNQMNQQPYNQIPLQGAFNMSNPPQQSTVWDVIKKFGDIK